MIRFMPSSAPVCLGVVITHRLILKLEKRCFRFVIFLETFVLTQTVGLYEIWPVFLVKNMNHLKTFYQL